MDSPENSEEELRDSSDGGTTLRRSFLRSCFAVAFAFVMIMLLSFSVLYFAVLIGNLSIWSPISVQSRCRIVSSCVDLRSSKVEYVDHSGQARFASAEAPNEALPYNCRPNFGAAWLTKDKFKLSEFVPFSSWILRDVNETYECWYTLGISKVNMNNDGLFNCQAEDPSTVEMLKRYSILLQDRPILPCWHSDFVISGHICQVHKVTQVMVFQLGINTAVEMGSNSWSYFRLSNVLAIRSLHRSCLPIASHTSPTLCILDIHALPKYYFIKASLFLWSVFFLYELGHHSIREKARVVIDV
ncbi:hypothetical protein SASPL_143351 [Salvia splendens]|uniref:Uncharacterized protein n=1 Tax=Salvia splendens TaxID=180675 RepID=A0A8X8WNN9_SALSN|nr:hypothetical protein SASPL_143351 [Salvia splendens]